MIKINLKNESAPQAWSEVFDYIENLAPLNDALTSYLGKKNIVLIGNGGSITSYDAYIEALGTNKKTYTLWSMEPDFIKEVLDNCPIEETVVVAVSKSGQTLGLIETLSAFSAYDVIAVTNKDAGTLSEIAKKMNWRIIEHPAIGGRFSGATSSAFVPSILAGINVAEIQEGISYGYGMKDGAYSLAKYLFDKEQEGYGEVYVPIYSKRLGHFQNLIIQLMHESVCKGNKGQTFYSSLGPEAQHHTNQRFIGGKNTVVGVFVTVKNPENDLKIVLPEEIRTIDYKGEPLSIVENLPYQEALLAEYIGTKQDADANNVPNVTIELEKITAKSVGALVAFWHLVAFYSATLRDVDPFNQPAVEASKNITLEIVKSFK